MATIDTRRRVKHYVLNDARQWVDRGTGHVSWIYNDKQRTVSLIVKSESDSSILLEAKILLSIVYQRQQDTLIVWSDTNRRDLALSFQEKAGCDEIWEKICEVLGEDSSLDITSSRGSSGPGSGSNGNDNLDESDEDQLDNDINTSPTSDLPPCELNKLKEIREFFIIELPRKSKIYKERLASILESDSYIKKLIEIFHICEDLENMEGLNYLFEIFRSLFYLNKSSLLDVLLSDELIMDVIGCLEYDPNKVKQNPSPNTEIIKHREYIKTRSNFKEIISFDNTDLVNKIHQTYKVQYIQDVILPAPSVFEENSLTSLSSFIFLNKVEISNLIQEDERFLNELFDHLKNPNLDIEKRKDMLLFLREFTSFLHGLQQTREPFFRSLYDHGILDVIEITLDLKSIALKPIAIDILSHLVEVSPTMVREYILNEIESKSSINNLNSSLNKTDSISNKLSSMNSTNQKRIQPITSPISSSNMLNNNKENQNDLDIKDTSEQKDSQLELSLSDILNTDDVFEPILINYVIRQMINDPDPELSGTMQIINILKLLIDPENMLSAVNKAEKSEFLSYFYRKSMLIIINPLMLNTHDFIRISREDFRIAQLENLILDFLSFCVEHHTYHIKNYILHKDLLKHILVLLKSKHQFLALSALKFLRKTIGLKEDYYNKLIIKQNLLKPVVEALKTNGGRYNILNSAIIELFDFIRSDDIKSLMVYVIENYYQDLECINYVNTFRDLKLRYDQHKEKINDHISRSRLNSSENTNGTACNTPSLFRRRNSSERHQDRLDFDKEEDAWIEDDEDENNENRIDSNSRSSEQPNDLLHLASSSSSSSNSNDEQIQSDNQFESYLELKKSQNQLNLDENEDTLFSPAKSNTSPSSNSNNRKSLSTSKSISIKISSNTVHAICNKSPTNNEENGSITNRANSPSSPSSKSLSPASSPTTPTNSPINSRKHALVDYEDDSEDDENETKDNDNNDDNNSNEIKDETNQSNEIDSETKEPLAKRQATETNSILSKLVNYNEEKISLSNEVQMNIDSSESEKTLSQEENKENQVLSNDSDTSSPIEAKNLNNACASHSNDEKNAHINNNNNNNNNNIETLEQINLKINLEQDNNNNNQRSSINDSSTDINNQEPANNDQNIELTKYSQIVTVETETTKKFPNINNLNGSLNGIHEHDNDEETNVKNQNKIQETDPSQSSSLSPIITEPPANKRARLSNS